MKGYLEGDGYQSIVKNMKYIQKNRSGVLFTKYLENMKQG